MVTKLIVCAREVVVDSQTNHVSVFNVFDGISVEGFPLLLTPFSFLTILERELTEPPEHDARFQLLLGDTELVGGATRVNFQDKRRTRQIARLDGLVLTAPGIVRARFYVGDHLQAEYAFEVERAPQAAQPQMTSAPA